MATQSPSDGLLRNGHPQGRPQPAPMQHSAFSYPAAGTPQSASQPALGAILSPQPRIPANMQGMPSPGPEWALERPPAVQDPNRPSSQAFSGAASRTSSESPRPYATNGQPQPR